MTSSATYGISGINPTRYAQTKLAANQAVYMTVESLSVQKTGDFTQPPVALVKYGVNPYLQPVTMLGTGLTVGVLGLTLGFYRVLEDVQNIRVRFKSIFQVDSAATAGYTLGVFAANDGTVPLAALPAPYDTSLKFSQSAAAAIPANVVLSEIDTGPLAKGTIVGIRSESVDALSGKNIISMEVTVVV